MLESLLSSARRGLRWLACLSLGLASLASAAQAHFLWLKADRTDGKPTVRAFLSETPEPDSAELLKHIEKTVLSAGGHPLTWSKDDDTFLVALPSATPGMIDGYCDLGLKSRGETTFRLLYTGRAQFGVAAEGEPATAEHLRVRVVKSAAGEPVIQVTFRGKPVSGALVKAYPDGGEIQELTTDDNGQVRAAGVAEGKTGLLAKWIDKAPGELDGKPYQEVRYYATLTLAPGVSATDATASADAPFAVLPEAVNSFGGAVSGDWLYVYSGHVGETHKYHRDTTTPHFRRLNLKDRQTWEELPSGPPLQGVTLLAHGGKLYRVGGMAAHNAPGEPDDLRSVADFACFDPATKTWTSLPSLPEPRSTHDAVVAGDLIYVLGGWNMEGGAASTADFVDSALVFDLTHPELGWKTLPQVPFTRRALAVATCRGKVYALGGLQDAGGVSSAVDIYDPATGAWSQGPELPGGKIEGFAPSAFEVDGRLYLSGHDGFVYRLSEAGDAWEPIRKLAVPRLTHRLLPGVQGDLLAVGGTFTSGPVKIIESVPLDDCCATTLPQIVRWSAQMPGPARQGQAVGIVRSRLVAVGGNRTTQPHAFDAENLVADAAEFALGTMSVDALPALPEARQSAVLLNARNGRTTATYLIGGIGSQDGISRTLGDVFKLDAENKKWDKVAANVADNRGMFGAFVYNSAIYVIGGSVWDPRKPEGETSKFVTSILKWDLENPNGSFETTDITLPRGRRSFAGALLGSKYYLVGGLGENQELVQEVDVLDLETGTWSTASPPSDARLFAELAALDGKLYLAGGVTKQAPHNFVRARSIEQFDPATQAWTTTLETAPVAGRDIHILSMQSRLLLYAPGEDEATPASFALVAP